MRRRLRWAVVIPLAVLVADGPRTLGVVSSVTLAQLPTPGPPVQASESPSASPSEAPSVSPSPSGLTVGPAPGGGPAGAPVSYPVQPVAPTVGGFSLPTDGSTVALGPGVAAAAVGDAAGTTDVVVLMNPRVLRFDVRPGGQDPGGTFPGHPDSVNPADPTLVAAFNSGFKLGGDSRGGFYLGGTTARPLRDGAASFVTYADGSATVGAWNQTVRMTSDVVGVRQNLDLLVADGQPNPTAQADRADPWGATLNNAIATNRSGLGVRPDGVLVYVQGPSLTPAGLAGLLVRAGASAGMTLDINPMWPLFTFVRHTAGGTFVDKLTSTMTRDAGTYTSPTNRDFIAVMTRDGTPLAPVPAPTTSQAPASQPAPSRTGTPSSPPPSPTPSRTAPSQAPPASSQPPSSSPPAAGLGSSPSSTP